MYENKLDDIGNKNMIQEGFEDMKSKIPNPNQLSDTGKSKIILHFKYAF